MLVAGQVARDLVLTVPRMPDSRAAARVGERRETLGGKGGNLAVASAQLGQRVALLGVVGDDEIGRRLVARIETDGVDAAPIVCRTGTASGLVVRIHEDGGRWHQLEDLPPPVRLTAADAAHAQRWIEATRSVIIELRQPSAAVSALAQRARAAGCRIVLDGLPVDDGRRESLLRLTDVLRADHRAARELTGDRLGTAEAGLREARALQRRGPRCVVLDIDGGTVFVWRDGHLVLPRLDVPIVDTAGAGAAFTATLIAAHNHGLPPHQCARWAVAAAAATAGHTGGRPRLTIEVLRHYLAQLDEQGETGRLRR
ncbi:ribokinase [Nocardia mexicana]|uniref:Ribokinase n=1 Tax=Nocardia mexicana TaxID=279262 RepID=A0A370H7L4_9NOCA|nr:ribokinase [Nocardia mexicana]